MTEEIPIVLLISSDLFFAGNIEGTTRSLGLRLAQETQLARLETITAESQVVAALYDLNSATPTLEDITAMLPADAKPLTIAYGPHVATARLQAARDAGFDHVLPRSRFQSELPVLLKRALGE